ncbi:hypothetical protein TELCIR_01321 [Teladorsagia circumcincta]|uniref:Uncharacterized protein n=1 Tax=Teladorsagia circumcincta TaxID=45464 RepID=A0A2G9V294_TELCI|nr:hypothetical protein TELCIR_01321 [Teladorsagia circumcincta]
MEKLEINDRKLAQGIKGFGTSLKKEDGCVRVRGRQRSAPASSPGSRHSSNNQRLRIAAAPPPVNSKLIEAST